MMDIKLVVVGEDGVGKTCLIIRYVSDDFPLDYVPTVFDNINSGIKLPSPTQSQIDVNLGMWDTASGSDYDLLRPISYPNTDVFVLAFSVDSRSSFDKIKAKWIPELKKYVPPDVPMVLIGTKMDLSGKRVINYEEGQQLAQEINAKKYLECSAKKPEGVKEVFEESARIAIEFPRQKSECCVIL